MSDLRKAAEQMLDAVDAALNAAYDRVFPVCCGKGSESGCCGQPDQTWTPQDEALMALLAPVERNLRTALAAEPTKPEPVAWQCREHGDDEWFDCSKEAYGINPSRYVYRCLYAAPPDAETLRRENERLREALDRSLTDEQIRQIAASIDRSMPLESAKILFARRIEAAMRREDV